MNLENKVNKEHKNVSNRIKNSKLTKSLFLSVGILAGVLGCEKRVIKDNTTIKIIEQPLCVNPRDQMNPKIYKNKVVWLDERNRELHWLDDSMANRCVDWDIYMYDLSKKKENRLTAGDIMNDDTPTPVIDTGGNVAWNDSRGICVYSLMSDMLTIFNLDGVAILFDIRDGKIVYTTHHWSANMGREPDVIGIYDIPNNKNIFVKTEGRVMYPIVYDNKVIFYEYDEKIPVYGTYEEVTEKFQNSQKTENHRLISYYKEIYNLCVYDLSTGQKTILRKNEADSHHPEMSLYSPYNVIEDLKKNNGSKERSVYHGKIVYDEDISTWDIYKYDLGPDGLFGTPNDLGEVKITKNTSGQFFPVTYGDKLVYHDRRTDNRDIYMFDRTTGIETQITTNTANQHSPAIYGNKIVWIDERNGNWDIYMATIIEK